jgi:hypothetical protein
MNESWEVGISEDGLYKSWSGLDLKLEGDPKVFCMPPFAQSGMAEVTILKGLAASQLFGT